MWTSVVRASSAPRKARRLDVATVVGILVAFGAVAAAAAIGGVDLSILYQRYEAFVLVIGGTIGATLISFPYKIFARGITTGFRTVFADPDYHERDVIAALVRFADQARRHGLLALESEVAELEDHFMRKGIQLVIDGRDTDIVRKILETEAFFMQERNAKAEAIFMTLGGYSPTLGIIGTVLGLIAMLKGLGNTSGGGPSSITGSIGTATAQAFVATFFGILLANLLWLPMAAKIKERNKQLLLLREIMIEGILSIQAGDNPGLLEEKLNAFLEPIPESTGEIEGGQVLEPSLASV
jgi:chemotaxis protein MotA